MHWSPQVFAGTLMVLAGAVVASENGFAAPSAARTGGDVTVEELDAPPRPDWWRPSTLLNGAWDFDFDPADAGLNEKWFESHTYGRKIQVPFPWQSPLSGIGDASYQGAAWYQREVTVPKRVADQRVFLVFGAVDWQATVWIDSKHVADHEGGYTPFEVELTDCVKPGKPFRVTVRAYDATDPETLTGKQTEWYTPSGGIWQTVYLEYRGRSYVRQAHVTPEVDHSRAIFDCEIEAVAPGNYTVAVQAVDGARHFDVQQQLQCVAGVNKVQLSVSIPSPRLWSPDSPALHDARIVLKQGKTVVDSVSTYFGMRKISRGAYGGSDHEYILLNNKPVYLRGALDQSFNPQGLYAYPSDAYIRGDFEKAKELGLNFLRIHIKVDDPRVLYWADKLGVLLMCDMPKFTRKTPRAQASWEQTLRGAIARDFNHPAIFAWCDFNETWGIRDGGYGPDTQAWVRDMYLLTKQLDPTRLAEDNSPCKYDHVATDINSWHFYIDQYETAAKHVAHVVEQTVPGSTFNFAEGWKQDTAPLINSEYGGLSARGGDRDVSWFFLYLTNLLRKYDKICGYVYTELSDIEWEHNGFLNYDRSPKEFNYPAGITLADLQGTEFPVLDCAPYQQVDAFAHVTIPMLLSHWSEQTNLVLRISVEGKTVDGTPWDAWFKPVEREIAAKPYAVTALDPYTLNLPGALGIINVIVEVLQNGQRCAANYCVINPINGLSWVKPDQYAASFPVDQYSASGFTDLALAPPNNPGKVYGHKSGFIEYELRMPRGLKPDKVAGCRLIAEIAAKADAERLDWPARRNPADYPQTDGKQWPTDVTLSINGVPFKDVTIENDFADARGVLSHAARCEYGSRGTVIDAAITGPALQAVMNALADNRILTLRFEVKPNAEHAGGLALYGSTMGSWAADPTLAFSLNPDVKKPRGVAKVLRSK